MPAKFRIPEIRPGAVPRPRLYECLQNGSRRPLTLVSAPPGSGKTVLVSSWVSAGLVTGHTVWITLDQADSRPGIFWTYVLQGLRRSGLPVADEMPGVRAAAVKPSFLIRLAAMISQRQKQTVLILDNAEILAQSSILHDLDFVLRHAAPQLRLVMLSRVDPALPLHRYRLEGAIAEIRLNDLAFTPEEAEALVITHGVHLPAPLVETLTDRTEGWAAGLRLAALSLRSTTPEYAESIVRHFRGDQEDVAQYFIAEVLDPQPPDVRDFLLRTSVADDLSPTLTEKLSGRTDAARMISMLTHSNTFLEASGAPGTYHYHRLFRDVLRAQLAYEMPASALSLHRKAARWLAEAGRVVEAVQHAAAARDWGVVAELVVNGPAIARVLMGPDTGRLTAALAEMPADTPGAAPSAVLAALALAANDPESCGRQLLRAREALAQGQSARGTAAVLVALRSVEALLASRRGDVPMTMSASAQAESALAELGGQGAPAAQGELRAVLSFARSRALLWNGDLARAEENLSLAVAAADASEYQELWLRLLGDLALVNAVWGRLRRALRIGLKAIAAAERHGLAADAVSPLAHIAMAWIYAEKYDVAAARQHIRGAGIDAASDDPVAVGALALVRARLLRIRGDYAAAVDAIRQARLTHAALPRWLDRLLDLTQSAVDIHRPAREVPHAPELVRTEDDGRGRTGNGFPDTAALAALTAGVDQGSVPLEVRVMTHLAAAADDLDSGHRASARVSLERALRLAKPESLRRPVIEAPPRVRNLLRNSPDLAGRHGWLGTATVGSGHEDESGAAHPPILVDALTTKELEVLENMAELLSTDEIAMKMFVSVNTVKTHIRKILRKLAVSRRNDAIRRARELGLLRPLDVQRN